MDFQYRIIGLSKLEASLKPSEEEIDAFESAVARLPHPVFVIDSRSRLRAMNDHARQIFARERMNESQLADFPSHPLSRLVARLRAGEAEEEEMTVLPLGGTRYEVIHSTRSPKGGERWLMLMLRPFPSALAIDRKALRKRWSLTPREADVAALCIGGKTTPEICESLSISRETLKTHMGRLLDKAGCEGRSQLIAKYLFGD